MATVTERQEFRISPEDKRDLERAANIEGVNVGEFIRRSVRRAAHESIEQHHLIIMNSASWDEFSAAVDAPGVPNEGLRKLLEHKSVLGR